MAIYEITNENLLALTETNFGSEGIYERKDIQRLLKQQIDILSDDLMVIAEEFGEWADSNRRIDLLCLDRDANLVVVEIKRTEDGGHMELQAIRYAAMVSAMTFQQLINTHAVYLSPQDPSTEQAGKTILDFLNWSEPNEDLFAQNIKIVLASADFSKELTTSVIWLNQNGLDIRCVRLKPYKMGDGRLLLDVQQIIPLPEAADYQTKIREKEREGRQRRTDNQELVYKYWATLLEYAKTKTPLHANLKPGIHSWVGRSIGKTGLDLNYCTRGDESRVELYIDFGAGSEKKTLNVFREFENRKDDVESAFGDKLDWQELPEKRACRICKVISGGWRSPQEQWPRIHEELVDAMIRLDKALRPFVTTVTKSV